MAKTHIDRVDLVIVANVLVAELSRCGRPLRLVRDRAMRPETGARISVKVSWVWMLAFGGLVRLELRFGGLQGGAGIVPLDLGAGVLRQQLLVALQVAPGLHDLRLVLSDLRLDLPQLRLQGPRIEFEEDMPSFTRAPSSTFTFMIWLSMRGLIWTEAIDCTVPTASTATGIARA